MAYRKHKIDDKLRRKAERSANAERDVPYLNPDRMTITINEMVRAVSASV